MKLYDLRKMKMKGLVYSLVILVTISLTTAMAAAQACGNRHLDPGEQCDDGAKTGTNGSCCSSTCQFEPRGTTCNDHNSCTVGDQCDGLGVCVGGACQGGKTCGQLCGATLTCQGSGPSQGPGPCKCAPSLPPCGDLCNEACSCPTGTTCTEVIGIGSEWVCLPSETCAISQAPACGGTCFSGHCGQALIGTACTCLCDETPLCPFIASWTFGSGDAPFNLPIDVAVDGNGNVFVAEGDNDDIQKFTNDGTFVTKWGSQGTGNGQFLLLADVAVELPTGNVFVADEFNNRVQKFDNNGTFITKWGSMGSGDGQFGNGGPQGVAVDANGHVFVLDFGNSRIQKFTNTGTFLTKWGTMGSGDGQFKYPNGVAVDGNGNVFVTDSGNGRIQKFDNMGTFLAKWGSNNPPVRVAVDGSGNLFVTDTDIEEFTNTGTFIGRWGCSGSGEGQFNGPIGLAVDGSGNVFVADTGNNRIQKFMCP